MNQNETKQEFYLNRLNELLWDARAAGVELSVERVPRDPSAPKMGDMQYKTTVWDTRKPS
jgi:hypothetical protein